MTTGQALVVVAVDEQSGFTVDTERWRDLALASLRDRGVVNGELNLIFVDELEMKKLNRAHMGKDSATDVLSFPLDGPEGVDESPLIGDVVVCPQQAAANSAGHVGTDHHSGTTDDELALLIVHGVLHVLGHDHITPEEAEAMEAIEQDLLQAHYR